MKPPYTHGGSRQNLLGATPDPQLVDLMSNEEQVTAETPPAFIVQTDEDSGAGGKQCFVLLGPAPRQSAGRNPRLRKGTSWLGHGRRRPGLQELARPLLRLDAAARLGEIGALDLAVQAAGGRYFAGSTFSIVSVKSWLTTRSCPLNLAIACTVVRCVPGVALGLALIANCPWV